MTQHNLQAAAGALQRGAFDEAKAICERVLARDPNNPEALFLLGGALAQSGQTRAAEPVLERANVLAPGHLLILNSLGGVYGANGKPEQAVATLNAALAIDPQFPWALQNLGAACKAMGDFASARRHFEKALQGHPHLVEALSGLADIVLLEGDTTSALQLAERVLALAPNHLGAKLVQIEGELNQGRPDQALRALELLRSSTQLAPAEQVKLHTLRGRALERLERYDEAFDDFAAANRLAYERERSAFADADSILSPATVAALTDFLLTTDAASWPAGARRRRASARLPARLSALRDDAARPDPALPPADRNAGGAPELRRRARTPDHREGRARALGQPGAGRCRNLSPALLAARRDRAGPCARPRRPLRRQAAAQHGAASAHPPALPQREDHLRAARPA